MKKIIEKKRINTDPSVTEQERINRAVVRRAAAEGIVLLENNGVLPLKPAQKVAVYGVGARYTIQGGTGSGSVNNRYSVTVDEGLREAGLQVVSGDWLDQYDEQYQIEYEKWKQRIYALAGPSKDFYSLYFAHAGNPMQAPKGMKVTRENKADTDTAIYIFTRISGEGADRKEKKGDYYLSDDEREMIEDLSACYEHLIVVVNAGGVVDLSFMDQYKIDALVVMSQAGMEGGNALADVLTGRVNPSGRLTDTWGYHYADYPFSSEFSHNNDNLFEEYYKEGIYVGYRYFDTFAVQPRYPFGYGLSYTSFSVKAAGFAVAGTKAVLDISVTNTGTVSGRNVVQIYASCPWGKLKKEAKRLVAFGKTGELQPGQEETLRLEFSLEVLESYHSGKGCYLLEQGTYLLLLGENAESLRKIAELVLPETVITARTDEICPLNGALKELDPKENTAYARYAVLPSAWEEGNAIPSAVLSADDIPQRTIVYSSIEDEKQDRYTELAAKLTVRQAAALVCGRPSHGSNEFIGNAAVTVPGAAGETTTLLKEEYSVANLLLADGPAGLRLQQEYEVNPEDGRIYTLSGYEGLENRFFGKDFSHPGSEKHYQFCSAIPIGTLLAQTFDVELVEEIGRLVGMEMQEMGITLWLAPGMNIHRNPLCGRNFEYYSEDPLISGKMAAAMTKGVQSVPGCGTTIKHFACNNQEEKREYVSSVVSERALREIYLKGFEIAVKEAQPMSIMTSYNKINGLHTANSYDLCTKVARDEWGFGGIIMTDWNTTNNGQGSSAAKCMRAGNDLIMPGRESDIREIEDAVLGEGKQRLDERYLRRCAANMLRVIFASNRYEDAVPFTYAATE